MRVPTDYQDGHTLYHTDMHQRVAAPLPLLSCLSGAVWRLIQREIKMADKAVNHPDGNNFDRFLYASVGEDRNGYVVTVLSALARLGLDPWQEASELGALSRDVAHNRLSSLLSGFGDVPALLLEHGSKARELAHLLPQDHSQERSRSGLSAIQRSPISGGAIVAILLVLAQVFFLGIVGSGE